MIEINIGVVTDSHMGGYDKKIAEALKDEGVDAIAFLGDGPMNDEEGLLEGFFLYTLMDIYDKVGVPTYWLPGNYESFGVFRNLFTLIGNGPTHYRKPNIINAVEFGKHTVQKDGLELDLVFVPGVEEKPYRFDIADRERTGIEPKTRKYPASKQIYIFNPNDLSSLVTRPEKTVILAHDPIRMDKDETPDWAERRMLDGVFNRPFKVIGPGVESLKKQGRGYPVFDHVGSKLMAKAVYTVGINMYLSGHIHNAMFVTDRSGNQIGYANFASQIFGTPGPAQFGYYGIFTFREDGLAVLVRKNVLDL